MIKGVLVCRRCGAWTREARCKKLKDECDGKPSTMYYAYVKKILNQGKYPYKGGGAPGGVFSSFRKNDKRIVHDGGMRGDHV